MKTYKIYLLLGILLSIAAVAFYIIDENSEGGQFMAPKKWKTITVFEDYSIEIMKFMKERDKGDLIATEKMEYENLIREIFITIEKYPLVETEDGLRHNRKQLFAKTLLKLRQDSAQPVYTKNGKVLKELSPSLNLDIPQMNAAWFSINVTGEQGTTATYHVFALYEHEGAYYLIRIATNQAFRDTYEATFIKMIQSFRTKEIN